MGRRKTPSWYPVFLDLHDLPVKVIGGGAVAARKVGGLIEAGARVTVIAPRFCGPLSRRQGITRIRRTFLPADLKDARLVFAATDDVVINRSIAELAERKGLWVNVASPPDAGRLALPASFRRGPLCVAVSTGGASAAVARALRKKLSANLDRAWGTFLALLKVRRIRIRQRIADPAVRRRVLLALGDPIWVDLIRKKGGRTAARRMDELIAQGGKKLTRRTGRGSDK